MLRVRLALASYFLFFITAVFAQNSVLKASKKPLIDTTTKSKGFLGGRLSTGLEKSSEQIQQIKEESADWKKDSKAFVESLGIKDLGVKSSIAARKIKKNLTPKDTYQDVKIDRRLGNYGSGNRSTIEEINVVKYVEDEVLSPYSQEIWWFDPAQSRIVNSSIQENKSAQICHGPFKKIVNEQVVEVGHFYMGTKDGRWEIFGPENELLDKKYYTKGFLSSSAISYYDGSKKKIKEVFPKIYGNVNVSYLLFYPGGNLKEEGKMDDSVKVGRWREFYEFGTGGRLKKEWKFPKDKFDIAEPILMVERDVQGKIIFQNTQKFD